MFWFTYAVLRENLEQRISQSSTQDKNSFVFDSPSSISPEAQFSLLLSSCYKNEINWWTDLHCWENKFSKKWNFSEI